MDLEESYTAGFPSPSFTPGTPSELDLLANQLINPSIDYPIEKENQQHYCPREPDLSIHALVSKALEEEARSVTE